MRCVLFFHGRLDCWEIQWYKKMCHYFYLNNYCWHLLSIFIDKIAILFTSHNWKLCKYAFPIASNKCIDFVVQSFRLFDLKYENVFI